MITKQTKNDLWNICYNNKTNIKCIICNKTNIKKNNYTPSKIIYNEEPFIDNLFPSCYNCSNKIKCDWYDYDLNSYIKMIKIKNNINNNDKHRFNLNNYMNIEN